VFDRGRIVETGTFDELIARGGPFAALARAQFLVPEAVEPPVATGVTPMANSAAAG